MSVVSTPSAVPSAPAKLPDTDEARLQFYAEVLMANVPALIADLSSAKYTFLSFSEKFRNEVKQKSALIQSIGRTFTSLQKTSKSLVAAQSSLEEYEMKLMRAAPPTFATSAEVLLGGGGASGEMLGTDRNGGSSASPSAGAPHVSSSSPATTGATAGVKETTLDNVLILSDDDIRPVRAAEEAYRTESSELANISRSCAEMETLFLHARDQCRMMTEHVQGLKWQYEEVYRGWRGAERERVVTRVRRDEVEERRIMMAEAFHGLKSIKDLCRSEELKIIEGSIMKARAEADAINEELRRKRTRYEVELATYQIAYKEQQAEAESLREKCKLLRRHQEDLEILAKKQQLEETDRNSLRKLMKEALTLTPSKFRRAEERTLTSEQQKQVQEDSPLVALLAGRISVLKEQRTTIGGLLVSAHGVGKSEDVSSTIDAIQKLLEPEIQLDEEALFGK